MDRNEIMGVIATLAQSQGFYGRLLRGFREYEEYQPDYYEELMGELEEKNFRTALDVVMFFECGC